MKLKKKITALCAAILLLVAASLCAAMLWQVREQSYGALLQRSLDSLDELAVSFETAVYQTSYEMGSALSWRVFLTHCFRSCGTAGSALYVNGECLFAATPVDPESYLTVSSGSAAASARVRAYGRNFLVLGKAVDFHGDTYCIYLVAEATYIRSSGSSPSALLCWHLLSCCWGSPWYDTLSGGHSARFQRFRKRQEVLPPGITVSAFPFHPPTRWGC